MMMFCSFFFCQFFSLVLLLVFEKKNCFEICFFIFKFFLLCFAFIYSFNSIHCSLMRIIMLPCWFVNCTIPFRSFIHPTDRSTHNKHTHILKNGLHMYLVIGIGSYFILFLFRFSFTWLYHTHTHTKSQIKWMTYKTTWTINCLRSGIRKKNFLFL